MVNFFGSSFFFSFILSLDRSLTRALARLFHAIWNLQIVCPICVAKLNNSISFSLSQRNDLNISHTAYSFVHLHLFVCVFFFILFFFIFLVIYCCCCCSSRSVGLFGVVVIAITYALHWKRLKKRQLGKGHGK